MLPEGIRPYWQIRLRLRGFLLFPVFNIISMIYFHYGD